MVLIGLLFDQTSISMQRRASAAQTPTSSSLHHKKPHVAKRFVYRFCERFSSSSMLIDQGLCRTTSKSLWGGVAGQRNTAREVFGPTRSIYDEHSGSDQWSFRAHKTSFKNHTSLTSLLHFTNFPLLHISLYSPYTLFDLRCSHQHVLL